MTLSGLITITYTVWGHHLGSVRHYACGFAEGGESYSAHWPSVAFFCPNCGDIWARGTVEHHFPYAPKVNTPWTLETVFCALHGNGSLIPTQQLDHADEVLLKRELSLELERIKE